MSKLDEILRSRGVLPAKAANLANPPAPLARPAHRDSQPSQDSQGTDPQLRISQPATVPAKLAEAAGQTVTCRTCRHFTASDGQSGHCRRFDIEAFADASLECPGYQRSALEERRRKVEGQLLDSPTLRLAADVAEAPLRPEPGPPVSIVVAVRTASGIVSGELQAPRDRFDSVLFFAYLKQIPENPS